ncbi:hypothetical protein [Scopulibacillus cellulosilyticus]
MLKKAGCAFEYAAAHFNDPGLLRLGTGQVFIRVNNMSLSF